MINKNLLKTRFSKSLSTYQVYATVQQDMAKYLISLLPSKNYKNILELGCGTGFLTKLANQNITFDNYTAIDIVKECKEYITNINPHIEFINQDIENIKPDKTYNLILSNATFQWINNFELFINNLKNYLEKDGTILFSTFGKKNFYEINQAGQVSLPYYSLETLKEILSVYKIEILKETYYKLNFSSIKEMLEHIKNTGVNAINEKPWSIKDLNNFKKNYSKLYGEEYQLTYNPIYVMLKK